MTFAIVIILTQAISFMFLHLVLGIPMVPCLIGVVGGLAIGILYVTKE